MYRITGHYPISLPVSRDDWLFCLFVQPTVRSGAARITGPLTA